MNPYKELKRSWDNFVLTIGQGLGLVKFLNWFDRFIESTHGYIFAWIWCSLLLIALIIGLVTYI
jgi:hypothetical protein